VLQGFFFLISAFFFLDAISFVHLYKIKAKKILKSEKSILLKPKVHGEQVESILRTCKTHEKIYNLNNTIPHNVHLVNPLYAYLIATHVVPQKLHGDTLIHQIST
jgi:hypothetical protein